MSPQDLDDLEAFLDTLTDADLVNQLSPPPAVPALGASGSAMQFLMLTLLAAGLSIVGWRAARPDRAATRAPGAGRLGAGK
jgi:hypothetical protein